MGIQKKKRIKSVSRDSLARVVKEAMEKTGYSIRGLGEESGTGASYIERLRKGDPGPAQNLAAVGKLLGFAPGELLDIYSDFKADRARIDKLVKEFLLLRPTEQKVIIEVIDLFREHQISESALRNVALESKYDSSSDSGAKFLDRARQSGFDSMRNEELEEREISEDQTDEDNEIGTGS
jgi:hypothetical protein